jgi:all-trans-retinol dehydrogenase (NAD+)
VQQGACVASVVNSLASQQQQQQQTAKQQQQQPGVDIKQAPPKPGAMMAAKSSSSSSNDIEAEPLLTLILWDIRQELMDETAALVRAKCNNDKRVRVRTYLCDISQRSMVQSMAQRVLADNGNDEAVDIVINNAGIVTAGRFDELSEAQIRRTFDVNTLGPLWVTRAFLPSMQRAGRGHFVTVASVIGHSYAVGLSDYAASKAAVIALHNCVRFELRKKRMHKRIHTTLVMPYIIDSGMFKGVSKSFKPLVMLLAPPLKQERVAADIVTALRHNEAEVFLPQKCRYFVPFMYCLPVWLRDQITAYAGGSSGMNTFTGHSDKEKDWAMKSLPETPTAAAAATVTTTQ